MSLKHVYKIIRLTLQLHTMAGCFIQLKYTKLFVPLNIRRATDYCSANEL